MSAVETNPEKVKPAASPAVRLANALRRAAESRTTAQEAAKALYRPVAPPAPPEPA